MKSLRAPLLAWILPVLSLFVTLAPVLPVRATDLVITSTSVVPSANAVLRTATAGATITAGKLVYKSATDNKLYLADCDSATAAVRDVVGIAVVTAATGTVCTYCTEDPALVLGATTAVGVIYVGTATAGGIAAAADLTTGWYTTVVAVGTTTTTVAFRAKPLRSPTAL